MLVFLKITTFSRFLSAKGTSIKSRKLTDLAQKWARKKCVYLIFFSLLWKSTKCLFKIPGFFRKVECMYLPINHFQRYRPVDKQKTMEKSWEQACIFRCCFSVPNVFFASLAVSGFLQELIIFVVYYVITHDN